jgi:hypothetical protein
MGLQGAECLSKVPVLDPVEIAMYTQRSPMNIVETYHHNASNHTLQAF